MPTIAIRLLATIASILGPVAVAPAAEPKDLPTTAQVQHGSMASVVLLHVYRLSDQLVTSCCPGATEAFTFAFLVDPKGDAVEPTFTETRDFVVDGGSYREFSSKVLGHPIEPTTIIRDVPDFFARFPDLRSSLPAGFQPEAAFVITIGGATLPDRGTGEITFKFGYHRDTEPFVFGFPLPSRPGA
ncbi:MAG: hypothetical protein IT508_12400 [Burkholderiaceae bacterium]|nr:hypothetical protein [Burkholderiaceae bacterium]